MSKQPIATGRARATLTVLAVGFLGVATGVLPVAGLAFERPAPPPRLERTLIPEQPLELPALQPPTRELLAAPARVARSSDRVVAPPATLEATLGQPTLPSAGGLLELRVELTADPSAHVTDGRVDVALVVDTSASMSDSIALLKWTTLEAIDRLRDGDRLVLITYNDEARVHFRGTVTPAERAKLRELVGRFIATKGTNIEAALEACRVAMTVDAGEPTSEAPGRPRRVVLVSDGEPTVGETSTPALLALGLRLGAPITTLGLGDRYERALLTELAGVTRGAFQHVDRADDLGRLFTDAVTALRAPALLDAELWIETAPGVTVEEVVGRQQVGGVVELGHLAAGERPPLVVRLRVDGAAGARDVVRVHLTHGRDSSRLSTAMLGVTVSERGAE